jgi:hypothetical protein
MSWFAFERVISFTVWDDDVIFITLDYYKFRII